MEFLFSKNKIDQRAQIQLPVLPFTNLSYLTSLIVSLVCKMGIVVHTSSKPCEKLNEVTDVIIKLSDAAYNILILNK